MKSVICFGEIMARLSPPDHLRLAQAMPGSLDVTFAGAEANAAVMIAALGGKAEFVSAMPRNQITDACVASLRSAAVGVGHIVESNEGRIGLYFVETGANQRGGLVIYDREASTFSLSGSSVYDWPRIFAEGGWFHVSGISASVSRVAAEAALAAVKAAKLAGMMVSCDLNYRRKLWRWDELYSPADLFRKVMSELLSHVDLVIGSGADLAEVGGSAAPPDDITCTPAGIQPLVQEFVRRFPQVQWVAATLREGVSATRNRWGALLLCAADGASFSAPMVQQQYKPYDIAHIVDRVGTGDAFAGALIFALQTPELSNPETALHFAVAASCLAHSIKGDFTFCSRAEVESLMAGSNGGAVSR